MASNSASEDAQQRGIISRQHNRGQSAGNQSSSTTSTTPISNNPSGSSSASGSSSTPTTSTSALPRTSSSVPVPSSTTSTASRTITQNSPHRLPASIPSSQAAVNATRSSIETLGFGRPAAASTSTTVTNSPSRREPSNSFIPAVNSNSTAASHLSTQQNIGPAVSLFNFGNARNSNEEGSGGASHGYGWRVSSAANPTTTNVNISQRSPAPGGSAFQSRPAVTSTSTNNAPAFGSQSNRGVPVGQQPLQQQPQVLNGSPHRNHANFAGAAPNWPVWLSSHQQVGFGSHQNTGTASGWTLADPAGWSGSASAGRICSGFEENQVVSFTWHVSEANLLRDEVESSPLPSEGGRSISAGAGKSEVWTTQPIFGDGKWKLELVRTTRSREGEGEEQQEQEEQEHETGKEEEKRSSGITVLSIYLTSMVLDYSSADLEIPASIMIGIKPVQSQSPISRRGAWIWREFSHFNFRRENEYYECHQLPSLSQLLEDHDIRRQDAFSLTIQISTGPRAAAARPFSPGGEGQRDRASNGQQASPFVVEDNQLVHHSLINGLERLLDCRSTGDVVLIVRERGVVKPGRSSTTEGDGRGDTQDEVWTLPVGSPMYDWGTSNDETGDGSPQVVVRDRLLWAHSSILSARSEFFHDMLQSHFSEGQEQDISFAETQGSTIQVQGRRVKTLRIVDADFTTIYWLLRYLYLEEVDFLPTEDVRCAALDDEWMMVGQVPADEVGQKAVWQWTPLDQLENRDEDRREQDAQLPVQGDRGNKYNFASSHGRSISRPGQSNISPDSSIGHQGNTSSSTLQSRPSIPHEMYGVYQQRRSGSDREARNANRSFSQEIPPPPPLATNDDSRHQSLLMDPHQHPCAKPTSASALALYRLGHRYRQQGLVHLSKTQLINSLTPQTAFPTLLATNLYEDLYEHVKAYVLDKWDLVSQTSEFERCCDEVSVGEWGVEAGRALRGFMIALRKTSL